MSPLTSGVNRLLNERREIGQARSGTYRLYAMYVMGWGNERGKEEEKNE